METTDVWMQGRASRKRLFALQDVFQSGLSARGSAQKAFSLRFVLRGPGRREFEGHWGSEAVMQALADPLYQGL